MLGMNMKRVIILLSALFVSAVSAAAAAAEIGADNHMVVHTQGDGNALALEQVGELNSLNLLIQAQNVSVDMLQHGSQNLIAGVNGAPEFLMAGHHSVVDIVQIG